MGISAFSAVMAVISATMSYASSQQQAQQQRQQQEYQAAMLQRNAQVAEQHAQLAEEEGREARRQSYEAAQQKRREAAQMVGRERAMTAFSGAQVDQGSALDLTGDIAERGAIDAFNTERAGDISNYRQQLRAWETRIQAEGQNLQAQALTMREPKSSFLGTALRQGANYFSMMKKDKPETTGTNM